MMPGSSAPDLLRFRKPIPVESSFALCFLLPSCAPKTQSCQPVPGANFSSEAKVTGQEFPGVHCALTKRQAEKLC